MCCQGKGEARARQLECELSSRKASWAETGFAHTPEAAQDRSASLLITNSS